MRSFFRRKMLGSLLLSFALILSISACRTKRTAKSPPKAEAEASLMQDAPPAQASTPKKDPPALQLELVQEFSVEEAELIESLPLEISKAGMHKNWQVTPLGKPAAALSRRQLYGVGARVHWREGTLLASVDHERLVELGAGRPLSQLYPEDHALAPGGHQLLIVELSKNKVRYQRVAFSVEVAAQPPRENLFLLEPGGSYLAAEEPLLFILEPQAVENDNPGALLLSTSMLSQPSSFDLENQVQSNSLYRVAGLASGDYRFSLHRRELSEFMVRVITINRDLDHVR